MLHNPFDNIRKSLSPEEIEVLQKFTGVYDFNLLPEVFFHELLIQSNHGIELYKMECWKKLSLTEKDFLFKRIRTWYEIISMLDPTYINRFDYTLIDQRKLEIFFKLESYPDFNAKIKYLESEKIRVRREKKLSELADWIEDEIDERKAKEHFEIEKKLVDNKYIISEALILLLFKEFGNEFNNETLELWKERFINIDSKIEKEIEVEKYKSGNNKHLLATLLAEIEDHRKGVDRYADYVKNRWLQFDYKKFKSNNLGAENEHSDKKRIKELIRITSA